MLSKILERTNSNIFELKKPIQEHEDDSDEDEFGAEGLLVQERMKRQKLRDQILELESEVEVLDVVVESLAQDTAASSVVNFARNVRVFDTIVRSLVGTFS
ncbi:hypothetical protein GN958_ATG16120 [Phytophthora infestans]|uniref:Uncharacterized protein n=1 Tax=Phytophthora infestans TaxID=4787 RepID=A0A8S9U7I2_PHYIN|nr:hypothetical protein GN958_ATG16120 [Phytophthora infestans]